MRTGDFYLINNRCSSRLSCDSGEMILRLSYRYGLTLDLKVYDWFLTIGEEVRASLSLQTYLAYAPISSYYQVELVWHAKRGAGQVLYYLNRYTVFIDSAFLIYC